MSAAVFLHLSKLIKIGNNIDPQEKHEAQVLKNPRTGEASPLYWACRNGDVVAVRTLLQSIDPNQLNQLEPNGSTALHAAAHNGHTEIVRILLHEKGVMRHRRNLYGLTAFQEAKTNEIRALFDRPENSRRFCSDVGENHGFVTKTLKDESLVEDEDEDEDDDDGSSYGEIRNDWLTAATSEGRIRKIKAEGNAMKTMVRSTVIRELYSLTTKVCEDFQDDELDELFDGNKAVAKIEQIIDEEIPPTDSQYHKARSLVSSYKRTGDITHLLRLYSLDTPFYSNINTKNTVCLMHLVFSKLERLQKRTFKGKSYRGLCMTEKDLRPYQLLHKQKQGVLYFPIFSSTSTKENEARRFIRADPGEKVNVLMIFKFPKKCQTAIQLFELSAELPAITDFPEEYEVLLLPMTLFRLTNIKYDKREKLYRIYLKNVKGKGGILRLLRTLME